jgi:hypothetical protein
VRKDAADVVERQRPVGFQDLEDAADGLVGKACWVVDVIIDHQHKAPAGQGGKQRYSAVEVLNIHSPCSRPAVFEAGDIVSS